MRNDKDIYLSLGLGSLIQNSKTNLKIQKMESNNDFAYRVNDNVGILFKYSAVRTSPWSFNFNVSQNILSIIRVALNYSKRKNSAFTEKIQLRLCFIMH